MSTATRTSPEGQLERGRLAGAAPQLVQVLRSDAPATGSVRYALEDVASVMLGRGDGGAARTRRHGAGALAVAVDDRAMSRDHAALLRVGRRWVIEDSGSKNGSWISGRRVRRAVVADGDVIRTGETYFLFRDAVPVARPELAALASTDRTAFPVAELATFVAALDTDLARLRRVVSPDVPIILHGETGTGKEVVARQIHALSGRRGDFVAINCGALAANLAEAELFGYRRGAFSGATEDRRGLVRAAHGGTLFLDEIGELPPALQVTLLRVLQEREVTPIGDTRPVPVDLQLCVATHRDLAAMVDRGEFRRDLHARLGGFTLALPPLCDRREDLGILVALVLGGIATGERAAFTPAAAEAMLAHAWPDNVRELARALVAALPLAAGAPIDVLDLPRDLARAAVGAAPGLDPGLAAERDRLVEVLARHGGNVAAVARELGKGRMQIHRWARRYGIALDRFRTA